MNRESIVTEQVCVGQCPVAWKTEGADTRLCTLTFGHEGSHSWQADYEKVCGAYQTIGQQTCVLYSGHTGPHIGQDRMKWYATAAYTAAAAAADLVTPQYYQGDYVMRIIEDFKLDFLRGTVVKYLLRAGNKVSDKNAISSRAADTELVDLEKAAWYLDRKIQQLKKEK